MLSLQGFLIAMAIAVFLPFFLRSYRTSGVMDFANIDAAFRRHVDGEFVASQTTVLFSDKRVDRFAPSEFFDSRAPHVAVYICKDRRGQHWLWKLYCPTEPSPTLVKLTTEQVAEMLQRQKTLLSEVCPKQVRSAVETKPFEKPKRPGFWDG